MAIGFSLLYMISLVIVTIEIFYSNENTNDTARELMWTLGILTINFVATAVLYVTGGSNWLQPNFSILILEIGTLGVLWVLAFRSRHYWPLAIGGFHIVPVLVMLVATTGANVSSYGLGVTQGVWGYLQLLVLIVVGLKCRAIRNAN